VKIKLPTDLAVPILDLIFRKNINVPVMDYWKYKKRYIQT